MFSMFWFKALPTIRKGLEHRFDEQLLNRERTCCMRGDTVSFQKLLISSGGSSSFLARQKLPNGPVPTGLPPVLRQKVYCRSQNVSRSTTYPPKRSFQDMNVFDYSNTVLVISRSPQFSPSSRLGYLSQACGQRAPSCQA